MLTLSVTLDPLPPSQSFLPLAHLPHTHTLPRSPSPKVRIYLEMEARPLPKSTTTVLTPVRRAGRWGLTPVSSPLPFPSVRNHRKHFSATATNRVDALFFGRKWSCLGFVYPRFWKENEVTSAAPNPYRPCAWEGRLLGSRRRKEHYPAV